MKSNRKLILILLGASVGMFGFGFALVPIYDILCQQLGINGKPKDSASEYSNVVVNKERVVTVEFMTQVQTGMPWEFTPKVKRLKVHPGELTRTAFVVNNLSTQTIIGQAVPSVSPGQAAAYLNKTECFCFNQQPLEGGAEGELPLIFYVDADLPESISTLTLSYTLYNLTEPRLAFVPEKGVAK